MREQIGNLLKLIVVSIIIVSCFGCSITRNVTGGILGNYMGGLSSDKAISKSQVFVYTIEACFEKVQEVLKGSEIDAKILKIDRRNYAILALISQESKLEEIDSIFDANSADVGIFLTSVGQTTTSVEIRSLSSVMTAYSAKVLFAELQKQN